MYVVEHALLVADAPASVVIVNSAPGLELDLAVREPADADLRALQVEQHRDRLAAALGLGADDLQHLRVVLVTAVREVEPRDVHAGVDQLADPLRRRRRGAEGTDDLRARHDGAE